MPHPKLFQNGTPAIGVYRRSSSEPWNFYLSLRIAIPNDIVAVKRDKTTGLYYVIDRRTGKRHRIHAHQISTCFYCPQVEHF